MSARDEHYESKFEYPLMKLIREKAEELDISYSKASSLVLPEYEKGIRYRDTEFEQACIKARNLEMAELEKTRDQK
ncbi:hypothetical protein OAH46_03155 [Verrucomicrobia bacterium]|nr:hypothetical protein [Verrucomicrobiota bacterium]